MMAFGGVFDMAAKNHGSILQQQFDESAGISLHWLFSALLLLIVLPLHRPVSYTLCNSSVNQHYSEASCCQVSDV